MVVDGAVDGIHLTFESFPGVELALASLDSRRGKVHPELLSVHERTDPTGTIAVATVFVPEGTLGRFLRLLQQYAETATDPKPRNANLIDRIASVRLATIQALWTDAVEDCPEPGVTAWWEVWLRRRDGQELNRFLQLTTQLQLRTGGQALGFDERTVVMVEATSDDLTVALDVLDDIAELRQPREAPEILVAEPASEQGQWVQQLADRLSPAETNAPAVCILDTGVQREHPLLSASLEPADCHACDPAWGLLDQDGHGTTMAGLALYGDLGEVLTSASLLRLRHRLESVKVFSPRSPASPPELYGAVTADAASRAEIQAPLRRRVFSLAVTAPAMADGHAGTSHQTGQPTSWSASIDALAAGRSIDIDDNGLVFLDEPDPAARRLFVISAGNVEPQHFDADHLTRSDLEPVHDPAQAWNALTVGAFTNRDVLDDPDPMWHGWSPVAARGELSPYSTTSVTFRPAWPTKPDIVLEGGNIARSPAGTAYDTPASLQLITTRRRDLDSRLLTVTSATSAATAQAAHLAARITADHPHMWPETIRALIVHSAQWTPAMLNRFGGRNKTQTLLLLRRYGMGVPDLLRATRSATDALTLVVEDTIRPFEQGRMREMHLHDFPWPADVLEQLGETPVRLRVTLSYFIEPNPANRGWRRRYSYASHLLRFDVRRPYESLDDFRKRLNKQALAEEERRPSGAADAGWVLGAKARSSGSVHSDIWQGSAVDLASRGAVAIFPVSGWWKENPARDRSEQGARYALVVSVETPGQDVDVWTPVAQQVGVPVQVHL
ncbi:S8 family peptidase [Actinoplanes derwentensis]|uniref:S8 family peptidase n=1 Tax=Actinoplanes derwentensis TaxID=113562 RepID=UPI001EF24A3B|nr:S8 family peptidase [Actinoplanes derwentensis]